MKKTILGMLLLLTLIISACANQPITGQITTNQTEQKVVKIGATLALTGQYAYIGQNELRGMEMAIEEINARPDNVKFKLIVEDNKGDAIEGATTANKLLNVDDVDIFFSAFTHITQAAKQTVFDSGKIMIYASTIPTIAQENNYTFRDYYDYKDHAIALAREIKQENYSDVYIMEEITDPCSLFDANFRNESERLGIKIITTTRYETTETDFKTDLLKMNPNKGDAMVLCSIRTEQFIMKQLKELGMIDVKTFHLTAPFLPAADTPELREIYEENDAISTWYGFGETSNTKMQSEFIDTYKEKYGQDPRPDAAYAYDDMHIIAIAISQCNSDVNNKDCVMQKMKSIKYFGVGGRLEFSDDRLSNREVSLIKVNEGKWQKIN